jgi:hypothetical protein
MNHYFYSQSQTRHIAVRLNGVAYNITTDYERVPGSQKLRDMVKRGSISIYLPKMQQDKTTGYKNLFLVKL